MKEILLLIAEVGVPLISQWAAALRSGDRLGAERASLIIAQTAAAKAAIRAARRR